MSKITPIYVAVIDDEESARRSLARLLRAAGFQPITYDSAESFLTGKDRPKFACLVLDIQLGAMSGVELAGRLVSDGVRTPTIFITAHDDPETRSEAEATGCSAYFRKTDSGAEVLEAIRRVTA